MKNIIVQHEKCAGCMLCQLRCSLLFTGMFNPLKARLSVHRPVTGVPQITFTSECNNCGVCATVCLYGALTAAEKEGRK